MVTKKIKTLAALKTRLKKTLPEKISEVIASYETFSEQPVPDDAKGFSAHHSACKSAVVHAETLLKLARWTEDEKRRRIRERCLTLRHCFGKPEMRLTDLKMMIDFLNLYMFGSACREWVSRNIRKKSPVGCPEFGVRRPAARHC